MTSAGRPAASSWLARNGSAFIVFAAGTILTVLLFRSVVVAQEFKADTDLRRRTSNLARAMQRRVDRHLEVLHALAAFYNAAVRTPDESRFGPPPIAGLMREAVPRRSDLDALAWAPRVTAADRADFARNLAGDSQAEIRRYDFIARNFVPAEARDTYYPVAYIEPREDQAAWLGFDTASETSRRTAIERALRSRAAMATETLPAHLPGMSSDTFEVFQPVYAPDASPGAEPAAPLGFLVARFRVAHILQVALTGYDDDLVQISVFEGDRPDLGRLIYAQGAKTNVMTPGHPDELWHASPVTIAGQAWSVVGRPTDAFRAQNRPVVAWGLLIFGLCLSGLGAAYVSTIQSRRAQMALLVTQLRETNRALEHEIIEHERAEAELHKLSEVVEHNPVAVLISDPTGRIEYVNDAFCDLTGYARDEVIGQNPRILSSGRMAPQLFASLWREIKAGHKWSGEILNKKKDGRLFWQRVIVTPIKNDANEVVHFVGLQEDITEQKQLQDQLQQAQKMEVVGRLAGGIAHDFNNILTTMIGFSDILREDLPPGGSAQESLEQIARAADRARLLTRQLLMFARKDTVQRRPVDVNKVLGDVREFVRRAIGEDVRLTVTPSSEPAMVQGDPSQLDQVLMNLAVNARDAMPRGGELRVGTEVMDLDEAFCRLHPSLRPGRHVLITVADKGTGMSEEVQKHLFEPFFTTKGVGKGTGLGLSTVYGIIKQMAGDIEVRSQTGQGTEFRIYVPYVREGEVEVQAPPVIAGLPRGTETILVVEDDDMVRHTTIRLLTDLGYKVSGASNGQEAMELCERRTELFDLILTDIVMPGMSGVELIQQLGRKKLVKQAIFASGFSEHPSVDEQLIQHQFRFMAKPFTRDVLGKLVRATLDEPEVTPPPKPSKPAT